MQDFGRKVKLAFSGCDENPCGLVTIHVNEIGLGAADAATIVEVTSCPGTDTCKLGIASARGLARELRYRLGEKVWSSTRRSKTFASK